MNTKQLLYHQINITNKAGESEYLRELADNSFFVLGIEVTDIDMEQYCTLNIDPQHNNSRKSNITSIEYVFNYQADILETLSPFEKIFMTTIRTDIDSIGAMALLTMLLEGKLILDGDIILRLKAIAKSDRHGRRNWKERREDHFHFKNYNIYGLPSGLAYMISDHKLATKKKVEYMIQYLKTGTFDTMEKYNDIIVKKPKKVGRDETEVEVIIPGKLCFVTSKYRGAIAYGYKFSPVVIARNDQFMFGKGESRIVGRKFTIAQYEDSKYIDLRSLTSELNALEQGFGGSSVIIGSRQDCPSELENELIIELTKKYLF